MSAPEAQSDHDGRADTLNNHERAAVPEQSNPPSTDGATSTQREMEIEVRRLGLGPNLDPCIVRARADVEIMLEQVREIIRRETGSGAAMADARRRKRAKALAKIIKPEFIEATAECSYMGRCNSSRCPKHGGGST